MLKNCQKQGQKMTTNQEMYLVSLDYYIVCNVGIDDNTRVYIWNAVWMNEIDHRIFALLKQQRQRLESFCVHGKVRF